MQILITYNEIDSIDIEKLISFVKGLQNENGSFRGEFTFQITYLSVYSIFRKLKVLTNCQKRVFSFILHVRSCVVVCGQEVGGNQLPPPLRGIKHKTIFIAGFMAAI